LLQLLNVATENTKEINSKFHQESRYYYQHPIEFLFCLKILRLFEFNAQTLIWPLTARTLFHLAKNTVFIANAFFHTYFTDM